MLPQVSTPMHDTVPLYQYYTSDVILWGFKVFQGVSDTAVIPE